MVTELLMINGLLNGGLLGLWLVYGWWLIGDIFFYWKQPEIILVQNGESPQKKQPVMAW